MKTQKNSPKKGNSGGKFIHIELQPGMNFAVPPQFAETAAWMREGFKAGQLPFEPAPHPKIEVAVYINNDPVKNTPEVVLRYAIASAKVQGTMLSPFITNDGKELHLLFSGKAVKKYKRGVPVPKEERDLAEAMARALRMTQKDIDQLLGVNGHSENGAKPKVEKIWLSFDVNLETSELTGTATYKGKATNWFVYVLVPDPDAGEKAVKRGEIVTGNPVEGEETKVTFNVTWEQGYEIVMMDGEKELQFYRFTPRREVAEKKAAKAAAEPAPAEEASAEVAEMVIKGFKAGFDLKSKEVNGHAECDGAIGWVVYAEGDSKKFLANEEGSKAKFTFTGEVATVYVLKFVGPEKSKITMRFQFSAKGDLLSEENFPAK